MMILEHFIALVGILAIIYAAIAKFLQNKLVDRSLVEGVQAKSKKLSEEFKKAKEKGNQKEMDAIMKKQMEVLPEMNKVMFAQFKPMIIIIGIFLAFTWVVGQVDPTTHDDVVISLADNGIGCDEQADDGIYSACYRMNGTNFGKWTITAKSFRNGAEAGTNSTYVSYVTETDDTYLEDPKGDPLVLSTDKKRYEESEEMVITADAASVSEVRATLDSGTHFRVDLPFTIPIFNVQRIYQPYWWFILISLVSNLTLSLAISQAKKRGML